MGKFNGYLLISLVVLGAFVWGYKRDSISLWLARNNKGADKAKEAPPDKAEPKPEAVPVTAVPAAKEQSRPISLPANPYQALARNPMQPAATPGARPYPSSGLTQTLDSIQPGEITDNQIIRRNAYFEKLSQQLKELKGETAPSPVLPPQAALPPVSTGANPEEAPAPIPVEQPPQQEPPAPLWPPPPTSAEVLPDQAPGNEQTPGVVSEDEDPFHLPPPPGGDAASAAEQ